MWKWLQQKQTSRGPGSGATSPTYGDPLLDGIPYTGSQQLHSYSVVCTAESPPPYKPTRPPRPAEGLPVLPFQLTAPQLAAQTILEQTSPQNTKATQPAAIEQQAATGIPRLDTTARRYEQEVEISPPSSPETYAVDTPSRRDANYPALNPLSVDDDMPIIPPLRLNRGQAARPDSRTERSRPESRTEGGTRIPVLRSEKRRSGIAGVAASFNPKKDGSVITTITRKPSKRETKWDPYVGEPTTRENGKPQQVKPSEYQPPRNSMYDTAVDTGAGSNTKGSSFGERVRRLRDSALMGGVRPEWKGSSGRAAIVPPVADRHDLPPLNVPRKSSKRAASPSPVPRTSTPLTAILSHEGSMVESPINSGQATPTVQNVGGRRSPAQVINDHARHNSLHPSVACTSPTDYTYTSSEAPPPLRPSAPSLNQNWTNSQMQKIESLSSLEQRVREALSGVTFPAMMSGGNGEPSLGGQRQEPPSRFSVTTYAPTTPSTTWDSPRVSTEDHDAPPLPLAPAPPLKLQEIISTPVMERKRPPNMAPPRSIDRINTDPDGERRNRKSTTRKAVPLSPKFIAVTSDSGTPSLAATSGPTQAQQRPYPTPIRDTNSPVGAMAGMTVEQRQKLMRERRTSSLSKTLPKTPGEVSSTDRISVLQAQLDDLSHRRANLVRSIKAMTELNPASPPRLASGLGRNVEAYRAEEERRRREREKVQGLREELADLVRGEHDLGLKLHRALRKRDEAEGVDPRDGGLWVRRVAG